MKDVARSADKTYPLGGLHISLRRLLGLLKAIRKVVLGHSVF